MPAPSGSDEITGETRYRTGWFGKLILQVEEVYTCGYHGVRSGQPSEIKETRWRDATVRDLRFIDYHERTARAKADGTCQPPPPDWSGAPLLVRGGYQPATGAAAPKVTPKGGSGGKKAKA